MLKISKERAAEILDPNHREHYDSIEPVNEACRMGRAAILRSIPRSPLLRGQGVTVTEQFYECLGEKCVAYHVGICLRLSDAVDNLYKRR